MPCNMGKSLWGQRGGGGKKRYSKGATKGKSKGKGNSQRSAAIVGSGVGRRIDARTRSRTAKGKWLGTDIPLSAHCGRDSRTISASEA